jgi:hypothetical protein
MYLTISVSFHVFIVQEKSFMKSLIIPDNVERLISLGKWLIRKYQNHDRWWHVTKLL